MKSIKNILVPTDFSVTARNAYAYAKLLAQSLDAQITVVHVNEYFIPVSEIAVAPLSEHEDDRLTEAMETFISDDIRGESGGTSILVKNNVKSKILRGDPVGRLEELSKSADLIVMGTTGLQDFLSKIIGSTSLEVANKAHCPVLLVPRDARWKPIDRIMYASNYDSTTHKMVREITDFAVMINAAVHFVHIEEFTQNDEKVTNIIWDELFSTSDPSLAFEIHIIYGQDRIKELKEYSDKNKINLMAFVSKHRNFWQNLIHNSVTQNISISTTTPMLVMHFDDV
jgi:nucleotide-binding universal stress UspA family protein